MFFFFLKQKTAYEMRISDWSSDVCSSDLVAPGEFGVIGRRGALRGAREPLEAAALVTPRDRAIEQHVVGRLPVEREARGEGLPALLAGDVIAVERSQRRRQARAVVGLVAREPAALPSPRPERADRCDTHRKRTVEGTGSS